MCQEGVRAFVENLAGRNLTSVWPDGWGTVRDGFGQHHRGGKGNPQLLTTLCPQCRQRFPVVRRELVSVAYNLPDVAVYHGLRLRAPCIAVGEVTSQTTLGRQPTDMARAQWQAMLWQTNQVAFIAAEGEVIGIFSPAETWGVGAPVTGFSGIVADVNRELREARSAGKIPHRKPNGDGDSNTTRSDIERLLTPRLAMTHQFTCMGRETPVDAPYWRHGVDILYGRGGTQETLAIEVKVDEDWDHPVNQPLANLLVHNAVMNIRVPAKSSPLDAEARSQVTEAERRLSATGRAAFITVV